MVSGSPITTFFRVLSRTDTRKTRLSPSKEFEIETAVVAHLEMIITFLSGGYFEDNDVKNVEETYFVITIDKGRTLRFIRDTEVKYADVYNSEEGFTMLFCLSFCKYPRIDPPFLAFKKITGNYPIQETPHNFRSVAYLIGPNNCTNTIV